METDKIEEVMDLTLEAVKASVECAEVGRLEVLNRLFGTLFHAYCNIERLGAEKTLLAAEAEKAGRKPSIEQIIRFVAEELDLAKELDKYVNG